MSLEKCLVIHRDALKNPEKAEIVAAKAEYMSRGMNEHDAAVQAIKDQIRSLEKQRADVITQGMKQWEERDPESFAENKKSPEDLASPADEAAGEVFRSTLLEAIKSGKGGPFPAKQWLGMLTNMKGVKPEEMKWSGVKTMLELSGDTKLSKEEMIDWIKFEGVEVETKVNQGQDIKYGQADLWLPGGENKTELLLSLPEDAPNRVQGKFHGSHYPQPNLVVHVRSAEHTDQDGEKVLVLNEVQSDWAQKGRKEGFFEGLTKEEKAEVEALKNERREIDVSLRRVYFDELDQLAETRLELKRDLAEFRAASGGGTLQEDIARTETSLNEVRDAILAVKEKYKPKLTRLHEIETRLEKLDNWTQPPAGPWVGNTASWSLLAMKRMIRWAADNGINKIAWTTGAQQVERYKRALQNAVDSIEWTKTPEGVQLVGYKNEQGQRWDRGGLTAMQNERFNGYAAYDRNLNQISPTFDSMEAVREWMETEAYSTKKREVVNTNVKEDALSDAIGKAMADQIREDPNQSGTIEGENIKISDTGMAGYYNKVLADVTNKYIKQWGAKVEEVNIHYQERINEELVYDGPDLKLSQLHILRNKHRGTEMYPQIGYVMDMMEIGETSFKRALEGFDNLDWQAKIAEAAGGSMSMPFMHKPAVTQMGFTITPEMRQAALNGQPLFSKKDKSNELTRESDGDLAEATLNSQLVDAIDDGTSAETLLDQIAEHKSSSKLEKVYAKFLRKYISGTKVLFGNKKEDIANKVLRLGKDWDDKTDKLGAVYNSRLKEVRIYDQEGDTKGYVLHELTHAATVKAFRTNGVFAQEMRRLYRIAENSGIARGTYGLKNVEEFIAEAFSNKRFQTSLQNIPYTGSSKLANVWNAFKEAVFKALGFGTETRTLFDRVIQATEGLLEENAMAKEKLAFNKEMMADEDLPSDIKTTMQAVGNDPKFVDNLGRLRRGKMYVQFLRDLKDNYGHLLEDANGNSILGKYIDRAFTMGASANELLKAGGDVAERWNELRAEKKLVNDLAVDATTSGVHPDIPLNQQEYDATNGRKITNKHLAEEDGTFSDTVQADYDRVKAKYDGLSDKAKAVYKSARDHMADNWNRREALLNKRIHEVYKPLIDDAERVGNSDKMAELIKQRDEFLEEHGTTLARVKGPYFPLSRFGDYYVVYKSDAYVDAEDAAKEASEALRTLYAKHDISTSSQKELESLGMAGNKISSLTPAQKEEFKAARKAVTETRKAVEALVSQARHYSNEAFESEGKAKLRADELGVDVMLKEDYFRQLSPVTQAFISRVGDAVAGALPEKQALAAREAMVQLWIKSLPDSSAMRSQLKRQSVAGFSTDMLRAFSKNAQADAHYLSRLEHMNELVSDLIAMEAASKKTKGLQAKELYNEVARRHVEGMVFTDNPLANALTGVSFVWQLGVSPAFLLTNLSQPWMISMPFMSGRHGFGRASNELAKAFGQVAKAAVTSFNESKSLFFEIDKTKFTADEQAMLNEAQRQGLLDITLEVDLSAMSKDAHNKLSRFNRVMSGVPHQVEVINRVMTALAAYRLERKKSDQKAAIEYALRVLDKTHIDYSSTNAPSPLKPGFIGGWGKVIFQYRKYQLGMLSLIANQMKAATKGSKEARNALIGLFAMHGMIAGAVGLPLAGSALFIANMVHKIFGDDDEPWDAEVAFRNWLADALGVEAGAVAAKGLPLLAGIDVSQRVGLGSIASPIQVVRGNKKGRDFWLEVLASGAGPTIGGLMPNMADGISLMGRGEATKGAEKMLPNVLANPIKAFREAEDGITTGKGVVSIPAEKMDAWDAVVRGLGFMPSIVSERGAAVAAVENTKSALKERSGELQKAWVNARIKNDAAGVAEAKQAIDEYNEVRKAKGEPTIKPVDLLNAYKLRRNAEKNMDERGVREDKKSKALNQYGRFADVS